MSEYASGKGLPPMGWPNRYRDDPVESVADTTAEPARITELWQLEHPPDREPTAETLEGAELLDRVEAFLARFVAFPSEHALIAATLWVVHAHAIDAFDTSPRLAFLSPEPGSGKTRALEIIELLVPRPLLTVNVTPAYLFRKVFDEAGPPTVLYDEIDTVFGAKAKDNEDIRGLLNSGYRKGATAGRCVIKGKLIETEDLPSYAAVAMAGLDDLPDTIMSRSIVVRMRRRAPTEQIEPYRRRVHQTEGHEMRDDLAAWVGAVWAELCGDWPDLPESIEDRDADVWEPLLSIADAAGGDWPERARVTAVTLVTDAVAKGRGFGVQLLADLRDVFGDKPSMSTETIIEALCAMDEAPWSDLRGKPLNPRGLSYRLGKYDVRPKLIRHGVDVFRGYERAELLDAWTRYLPAVADESLLLPPYIPPRGMEIEDAELPLSLPPEPVTPVTTCACGKPISDRRRWAGKTDCADCAADP